MFIVTLPFLGSVQQREEDDGQKTIRQRRAGFMQCSPVGWNRQ
jgi:hypothetical protein